jgi:hypothetical protein
LAFSFGDWEKRQASLPFRKNNPLTWALPTTEKIEDRSQTSTQRTLRGAEKRREEKMLTSGIQQERGVIKRDAAVENNATSYCLSLWG